MSPEMMSFTVLRRLRKHSGDVSEMRCGLLDPYHNTQINLNVSSHMITVSMQKDLSLKDQHKAGNKHSQQGELQLLANGLSVDSTIIVPRSAPHRFTRYSSKTRTFDIVIEFPSQGKIP
ncbi:hypothetical protein E3N88_29258 [Mikania micrantha]|uniref:Uncharacterized protein n=1 Tax=Mikania micrantha TaxID=192012 RepID=A0A5N6MIB3_9ASTR|nr:hypothetical protein E3N88_29258 [Mikania micrantha]